MKKYLGQIRRWSDSKLSGFKIVEYSGFKYGSEWFIIEYLDDNRRQTITLNTLEFKTEIVK